METTTIAEIAPAPLYTVGPDGIVYVDGVPVEPEPKKESDDGVLEHPRRRRFLGVFELG